MIATQDRAMDTTDPSNIFHDVYTTEARSNYACYSDPKIDALAGRALRETVHDKRRHLY